MVAYSYAIINGILFLVDGDLFMNITHRAVTLYKYCFALPVGVPFFIPIYVHTSDGVLFARAPLQLLASKFLSITRQAEGAKNILGEFPRCHRNFRFRFNEVFR